MYMIKKSELFTSFMIRCSYKLNATMFPDRVMEGEQFDLNCIVDVEDLKQIEENSWKRCVWTRNYDGASCIQTATDVFNAKKEACATSMNAVETESGSVRSMIKCSISVPFAHRDDRGRWTCRLEKCKDGKHGGCGANAASECMGEANVTVKVLIAILDN